MAKTEKQKLKLLYLRDYLCQNTDENHPASAPDLLQFLQSKGISAERKSLYDDIASLNDYGIEILYRRGKPQGYYATHRDFALPELKLLVDAVLSSRFLSQKQSAELIRKLAALSKSHEALLLRREIVLSGRVKAAEDNSFSNVDVLHEAIEANCQIRFRYFDWGVDLQKHYRQGVYTASPYALLWDDENYYLIAHSERHGLTHYRVDKMQDLEITDLLREGQPADFDPAAYAGSLFGMFNGQQETVKIRFENSLIGVVADRFGREVFLSPDGDGHFVVTAHVAVSPQFLSWVFSFGKQAEILSPQPVRARFLQYLRETEANYQ